MRRFGLPRCSDVRAATLTSVGVYSDRRLRRDRCPPADHRSLCLRPVGGLLIRGLYRQLLGWAGGEDPGHCGMFRRGHPQPVGPSDRDLRGHISAAEAGVGR